MTKDLRFNVETSFYLLSGDVKAAKEGEWKVTVNREALENILAAYDAALIESRKVIKTYEDHERPKGLSWYDTDHESDRLAARAEVAEDIEDKLTGK